MVIRAGTVDGGLAKNGRAAKPGPNPRRPLKGLRCLSIEEIEWPGNAGRTRSVEERRLLASQLRQALLVAAQALPPSSEARPAVLRPAITHVDTVSPLLNAGSTLLLFVPLDAGGAAVEIEAVEPGTRTQLAALTTRYEPRPPGAASRSSTWNHA